MTPSGFSMGTILKMNVSRRSCKQESKDNIDSNSNFLWSLLELNPSRIQMLSSLVYVLCFLGWNNLKHTAISRKVVEKNVHATIPKSNMGYDQYTVPDDCSCRTYFCCFPLTLSNIRPLPLVPFFQISLEKSALKTTHNTFRDCRVQFFRQPFST